MGYPVRIFLSAPLMNISMHGLDLSSLFFLRTQNHWYVELIDLLYTNNSNQNFKYYVYNDPD